MLQTSLLILLFSCATLLKAESEGYETLSPAQPTQHADKIEVIEFFWYGCPHCYSFEPMLEKWVKNLPKNVEFIRQPTIFDELWGKHAKAYFTAEALGVVDKIHADFFDAVQDALQQKKKDRLETEEQLLKFFVAHGVDEKQFHDAYNSFLVDAKMRQAPAMAKRYGITGVPTVIINGKFKVDARLAGSQEKMLEVMNRLIQQESKSK